jgi:hypothetical protein
VDKTVTNAYYDVEIDPRTSLPVSIRLTVLTGKKGATEEKNGKIVGGDHVAFHFEYSLTEFDKPEVPDIPDDAMKLLALR